MISNTRTLALLCLVVIGWTGCGTATEETAPPTDLNVVLVVIDSLRADHLGVYGYSEPTSPFLDGFAAESVVFENAYAASSHPPQSVAALLTGRLPTSGGSIGLEAEPSEEAATLARVFRGGGFHTGIVSNQPLLSSRGFTRGFEFIQVASIESPSSAEDVTQTALQFVDDYQGEPFFLYAHYLEPHQPYDPPAQFLERFGDDSPPDINALLTEIEAGQGVDAQDPRLQALIASYDAEIAAVDAALEALVDGLASRGVLEDTLIIVTGSQGEEFLEHDYLTHSWTLHQEVLRVPLLIRAPALLPPERIADRVSGTDLFPSLVELFGLDPGGWQPDGASFLRGAGGSVDVQVPRAAKLAELVIRERCILRTVIQDDWKYIAEPLSCALENRSTIAGEYLQRVQDMAAGTLETPDLWADAQREWLFNLADDPAEQTNLLGSASEQLASMRTLLEDYEAYCEANALAAQETAVPEIYDEEAAERLRSMGYL